MRGPSSVTATVCSQCAARDRRRSIRTTALPLSSHAASPLSFHGTIVSPLSRQHRSYRPGQPVQTSDGRMQTIQLSHTTCFRFYAEATAEMRHSPGTPLSS
jgi:hypothetical protein